MVTKDVNNKGSRKREINDDIKTHGKSRHHKQDKEYEYRDQKHDA